jgi:hypothetical protein
MDIEVLNRIILARHLFELGVNASKSTNEKFLFAAINLLQDSVEAFLLAVADHVSAGIDQSTHFDKYFDLINKKISPNELPFRNKLIRVNKLRINSKHYGIQPARDEVSRLFQSVRDFFEETSQSLLGTNFSTASVVDLLSDCEVKELLIEAKTFLEAHEYAECAINCRKAIYIELEREFDISPFRKGAERKGILGGLGPFSRAPYFTHNNEYIEKNVKEPTDYVVIDHSVLDQELLKYSVDNTAYWNVWRLTPEVWRDKDRNWYVKRDFDKLEDQHIADKIEYIYATTVDIIYSISIKKASVRSPDYQKYIVNLASVEVPVFEKADKSSKLLGTLPKELEEVDCDYSIEGFNRDGQYWHIIYISISISEETFLSGFIHDDFLVWKK